MRSTSSKPKLIELFAGAGLLSKAFSQTGFEIIGAIEQDKIAASTYSTNINSSVVVADIRTQSSSVPCEVLVAGPPCQGFSTLNRSRYNDPRNYLALEVVRWVDESEPQVVVVENVPGFVASQSCEVLKRRLERLDYKVDVLTLNALDYGCAQRRFRSFTIAHRTGYDLTPPRRCNGAKNVREAWEGLSAKPDGKNNHYSPKPSQLAKARMKVIPRGGDRRDVMVKAPELSPPSWFSLRSQVTDAWGRMTWDGPANTLRTALQNPSKGRYIHPSQNRVISLREAARLQGVPDNFKFVGTPCQIARQIGNGVPVPMGRAVARLVKKLIIR